MTNILRIMNLQNESLEELYKLIDKELRSLPKNQDSQIDSFADGFEDNDIDALRHSYVSGAYTMEFGEATAEILGRLNELISIDSRSISKESENMDLWNNEIGRYYGKKAKSKLELFYFLMNALKKGELIIDLSDKRIFTGSKLIKRKPKTLVITIQETKSGENIQYYDLRNRLVFSKEEFIKHIRNGKYEGYSVRTVGGKEFPFSKRDGKKFNNLG